MTKRRKVLNRFIAVTSFLREPRLSRFASSESRREGETSRPARLRTDIAQPLATRAVGPFRAFLGEAVLGRDQVEVAGGRGGNGRVGGVLAGQVLLQARSVAEPRQGGQQAAVEVGGSGRALRIPLEQRRRGQPQPGRLAWRGVGGNEPCVHME